MEAIGIMARPQPPADELSFRLLNDFQRDFPLCDEPFACLADDLGTGEEAVIKTLRELQASGRVSRVGAVFAPRRIGVSTLAALSVPEACLAEVAGLVNAFPGVNHNYEREHRYNLWFVVTAASAGRLDATIRAIEDGSGLPVLRLPLLDEYHIDLGFALDRLHRQRPARRAVPAVSIDPIPVRLDAIGERLAGVIQNGLPLVPHPYRAVGERIGSDGATVRQRIADWLALGVVKRFGVVVRHRELGFTANAMMVHDVPDEAVAEVGRRLAGEDAITLCYRRPRVLPDWRYNLFCMIHGCDRGEVEARIEALRRDYGLGEYAHEVLFSRRRFKQQGARYVENTDQVACRA